MGRSSARHGEPGARADDRPNRGTRSVEEVPTADRPGAGARATEQRLRPQRLLPRRGVAGQSAAADRAPGGRGELVEPVVAGRVDGAGVAPGLAAGQRPPVQTGDAVTAAGRGRCASGGGAGVLHRAPQPLADQTGAVPVVTSLPADHGVPGAGPEVAGGGPDVEVALEADDARAVVSR